MFKKNFMNLRRGGALVMTALSAIFMLGMTALVTDIGYLYYSQSHLQTAVNAGWKAGYDRMLELGKVAPADNTTEDKAIRAHILDVMGENGINDTNTVITISYTPLTPRKYEGYYLRVEGTQKVGLFFANVMNIASSKVYAMRENHPNDLGQGIVPLAIPHGDMIDMSRNVFGFDEFEGNEGFVEGKEYVLKLGAGGVGRDKEAPIKTDPDAIEAQELGTFIYIPMKNEDLSSLALIPVTNKAGYPNVNQTDTGLQTAYGAVYHCLRAPTNPNGNVPVNWLVGFNGGGFLLYDGVDLKDFLDDNDVNYLVLNDIDADILLAAAATDTKVLYNRPRIGIYSNSGAPGNSDIAQALITARIVDESEVDSSGDAFVVNDSEIDTAGLGNFDILLMADEDMTGYCGGCKNTEYACPYYYFNNLFGDLSNKKEEAAHKMCEECRKEYNFGTLQFKTATPGLNCLVKGKRCAEREHIIEVKSGNQWKEELFTWGAVNNQNAPANPDLICGSSTQTLCYDFVKKSATLGDVPPFLTQPYLIQQLKWRVEAKVIAHVVGGGHLFAKGFAAETFDLSRWQMSGMTSYADCLVFNNMSIQDFPKRLPYVHFTDINCAAAGANAAFTLSDFTFPRNQNHVVSPSTSMSENNAFRKALVTSSTYLGSVDANYAKYLQGTKGEGEYCYLAGNADSIPAKRLILNNILYASLSDSAQKYYSIGRQKSGYGPIDPDNYVGGGANDYRDYFMYGFNQPLQLWDRVIKESGNMRGPTDQAVDYRLDEDYPSRRFIIVPITDVPPEVKAEQPLIDTIYGLQGIDHPDGEYTPDQASFTASVRIIGFAEFELIDAEDSEAEELGYYQVGQVRGKFVRYIVDPREVEGMDPYVTP
ncbi:MAG: hypothetical protein CVV42_09775 [Candidatus Riflebacteria bacterium HGW-Riflebacteria-2]|jgi:hypothetical protein|nr:MAG: hypothetical protein CVV42_09775 [Candidatus Riflebacteria bacterium HGW-Riflebacteria-2]